MRIIALITQKGGAGKTTLAASLAVAAAEAGENVIALDLDPQGSLAAWGNDRKADSVTVDEINAERLARLSDILTKLQTKGFTLAILDCPGIASTATNLAMRNADLCLVPARPTRLDIRATKPTVEALLSLKRSFAFILNQCPANLRSSRSSEASAGLEMMGALAHPLIATRADFQDAVAAGQGVTEYASSGKAAEEIRHLWKWVQDHPSMKAERNVQAAVNH
jgi:chromosome partitioning protein